jgi:membrane-bound acyltransferase YfiQ involved in biofilm formation
MALVQRHLAWFAVAAILTTAILVGLFAAKDPSWGMLRFSESAWYVQKIAISGLVLLWFERSIVVVPKWLDVLGRYAFTIYFLHGYLLFELYQPLERSRINLENGFAVLLVAIANWIVVILLSLLIAFLAKKILGRISRYVIGT